MFYVDERVLIPRDETEILVEKAVEILKSNKVHSLCEVGAGSGALLLSILMDAPRKLEVIATDIDKKALSIARYNHNIKSFKMPFRHSVNFEITDRLSGIDQKFDLIVSNPPYIKRQADYPGVHCQVKNYEPEVALFLPDEHYYQWFAEFFKQVNLCLNSGGYFLMEGHEDHLGSQLVQAAEHGLSGDILKDYTHRDRFLILKK